MSSIYPRGQMLWVAYVDAAGKRRCVSTGCRLGATAQERERALFAAERVARELERQVEEELDAVENGPLTLRRYAKGWVERRRRRGVHIAGADEQRIRDFFLPALGDRLIKDIRPPEIRLLFRELVDSGRLAPRSIHTVYGTLRCLFSDVVAEEIRDSNPCVLSVRRRELPEKLDADPLWRGQAVYLMSEARQLCTDPRVLQWHRVLYALLFFTGTRIGEALQRRWRDYQPEAEQLGKIVVWSSWNRVMHKETPTKTRRVREVPVHPELARVLAEWRLAGWAELCGRPPGIEDLLFPNPDRPAWASAERHSRPRDQGAVLEGLRRDCARLSLRADRRTHDTRRSFISWARAAGASDALLRWMTHGPSRSILDEYTTPPWPALCEQVLRVRLDLSPAIVVPVMSSHRGLRGDR